MSSTKGSKGFFWAVIFLLTSLIYSSIPTHLIFNYWAWLNTLRFDGQPIYTLLLFVLFLWIVALIITKLFREKTNLLVSQKEFIALERYLLL
ncbi:MAG: hypothetical protein ACTSQU_00380 [Promethearchaeota archaeon]